MLQKLQKLQRGEWKLPNKLLQHTKLQYKNCEWERCWTAHRTIQFLQHIYSATQGLHLSFTWSAGCKTFGIHFNSGMTLLMIASCQCTAVLFEIPSEGTMGALPRLNGCTMLPRYVENVTRWHQMRTRKLAWSYATITVDEGIFTSLATEAVKRLREHGTEELTAQGAATLAWSFALVRTGEEKVRLYRMIAQEVQRRLLPQLTPQGLANIAWAYATAGLAKEERELFQSLASEALRKLPVFQVQEIAILLHGFARAQVPGADYYNLFASIVREVSRKAKDAGPRDLCTMAWSFTKLEVLDEEVFIAIAEAASTQLPSIEPRYLTGQLLWSLASAGIYFSWFFEDVASISRRWLEYYDATDIAHLAWSFASLEHRDEALFAEIRKRATTLIKDFDAQDLSRIAWSFAKLGVADEEFFTLLEAEVILRISEFGLQELGNVAHAFSSSDIPAPKLFKAIEKTFLGNLKVLEELPVDHFDRQKLVLDIKSLTSALGKLSAKTWQRAREVLLDLGSVEDRNSVADSFSSPPLPDSKEEGDEEEDLKPEVVLDLDDRLVLHKPPGWEVERNRDQFSEGCEKQLSEFLQHGLVKTSPIFFDASSSFGLLHRLDVSSSGLILVAKTYQAYHDLDLQLRTEKIDRDYIVLCRGLVPLKRKSIDARIHVVSDSGVSQPSIAGLPVGRPACTNMKVLAHGFRPVNVTDVALTLLVIRIDSGRRHQIRAHLSHIGHPIICDWLYSSQATFEADKTWCQRNFLHRYRLNFQDLDGKEHEATTHLPPDLLKCLEFPMQAKEKASKTALQKWTDISKTQPVSWTSHRARRASR